MQLGYTSLLNKLASKTFVSKGSHFNHIKLLNRSIPFKGHRFITLISSVNNNVFTHLESDWHCIKLHQNRRDQTSSNEKTVSMYFIKPNENLIYIIKFLFLL